MRRILLVTLFLLAFCVVAVGSVSANTLPWPPKGFKLEFGVDGKTEIIPPGQLKPTDDGFVLSEKITKRFEDKDGVTTAIVTIEALKSEYDPVLTWAASAIDFGAPSTFTFETSSPMNPALGAPVSYKIGLSGSYADSKDGGSLTPNGTFGTMDVSLNGVYIDGVGTAASYGDGEVGTYGPFTKTGTYNGGTPPYTDFDIRFAFKGSGGEDAYGLTGRFEVVPEPSILLLLGAGLLGVAGLRRKFKK